jgi:hypothetical protein
MRILGAPGSLRRGLYNRAALDADDPCSRRRVDDRAAALLEHPRDLVLHAQEDAPEVNVNDPVPLFLLESAVGRELLWLHASIVESKVQLPESVDLISASCGPGHPGPDRHKGRRHRPPDAQLSAPVLHLPTPRATDRVE